VPFPPGSLDQVLPQVHPQSWCVATHFPPVRGAHGNPLRSRERAARIRERDGPGPGRPSDLLPAWQPELAMVASVLGYAPEAYRDLEQDYLRAARRTCAMMGRLF